MAKKFTDKEYAARLPKKQVGTAVLFFNGHGEADSIFGHKGDILIKAGENDSLLKSAITYSLVCDSAAVLGPKAVENGANAFVGYASKFGFVYDDSREAAPAKDKFAQPFAEASNEFVLQMLRGNNVGVSYERSQRKFDELIQKYSASDAMPEYAHIRFWLFWDKTFQKVHGDSGAIF